MCYFCSNIPLDKEMDSDLKVKLESEIYIGRAGELLPGLLPSGRVVALSDANIDRRYRKLLGGYEHVLIGTGETVKTLHTAGTIYRRFIEMGVDRETFVLGIGGGIVTDMAGFVAATYMRGLRCGFVSTTLLGQVDASVGGKNGVNVDGYKNMVGTFSQPQFVVCDVSMLATLPDREFRAGLAEAVKAGVVGDPELFALLEQVSFERLRTDEDLLEEVVAAALRVKTASVARDERESGERRKLNLGHTLGHAIEKCSPLMNHGEAVAVGMAMISRAAVRLGLLPSQDAARIATLLERFGFALAPPVELRKLMKAVLRDKKAADGVLRVVLPVAVGNCVVRTMTVEELAAALR